MGKIEKLKEVNAMIQEKISVLESYIFINNYDMENKIIERKNDDIILSDSKR